MRKKLASLVDPLTICNVRAPQERKENLLCCQHIALTCKRDHRKVNTIEYITINTFLGGILIKTCVSAYFEIKTNLTKIVKINFATIIFCRQF